MPIKGPVASPCVAELASDLRQTTAMTLAQPGTPRKRRGTLKVPRLCGMSVRPWMGRDPVYSRQPMANVERIGD